MKENLNYYKKKISVLLFILTLIMGFHGLYSYYQLRIERPWQLLSAIMYGTMKMFFFVAPLPAEADTTISYEIAKWLAPIITSALVLTKITNALFHFKNSIKNHFSKKHLIIFEKNSLSDSLINNLLKEKKSFSISLISKKPIPEQWKTQYEKRGIAVYEFNFEQATPKEINELKYSLKINNVKAMVFSSSSDLENYSLFANIIRKVSPKNDINCYINCNSLTIPTYLEDILNQEKLREPNLAKLDIITFNQSDLIVRMLMNEANTIKRIFKSNFDQLEDFVQKTENLTVEKIDRAVGTVHFLIFSINELIEPLLIHIANDATLSLNQKIKVSIVDINADEKIESFISSNQEISGAIDINVISCDFKPYHLAQFLRDMKENIRPTSIFFLSEDTILNLEILKLVNSYFLNIPKILRNISGVDLKPLFPASYENIRVFGDINEIMTEQVLIRSSLDKRAKSFNKSYNKASSLAGMGEGSSWEELSQVKKSSSRSSAAHAKIKEEIFKKLFLGKTDEEIDMYLREKFEQFKQIQDIHSENPEKFKLEFNLFLEQNPILDYISRLEHKRWCNSYYAMNFRYGEIKDEINKTHPCLIDDWQVVIGEKFDICHPEYDLISAFALFPKED